MSLNTYSADSLYTIRSVYIHQMMHTVQDVALLNLLTASQCHPNSEENTSVWKYSQSTYRRSEDLGELLENSNKQTWKALFIGQPKFGRISSTTTGAIIEKVSWNRRKTSESRPTEERMEENWEFCALLKCTWSNLSVNKTVTLERMDEDENQRWQTSSWILLGMPTTMTKEYGHIPHRMRLHKVTLKHKGRWSLQTYRFSGKLATLPRKKKCWFTYTYPTLISINN